MRLHRFYIYKPLGEEIVVENVDEGKEIMHQWTHVFRYTSGDEVILFSALTPGKDFIYTISTITKQAITLAPVSALPNIISTYSLTLVMALVKKDTFETIVRQATELGVSCVIPVVATRSEKKNLNIERLKAISIEASEQSGRGVVPIIKDILSFEETMKQSQGTIHMVGSVHGGKSIEAINNAVKSKSKGITLWIGPEGGWTKEEEQEIIKNGAFPFKLSNTVLKSDTAATSLLAVLISTIG